MLIYTHQKSKTKKKLTKSQRELQDSWNELVNKHKTKKALINNSNSNSLNYKLTTPVGRETNRYPSLNSGYYDTFKKENKVYTGDKVKGIGTLHKSNAVPIFTDQEAKDQANMRR
jgi:hypothetical protein